MRSALRLTVLRDRYETEVEDVFDRLSRIPSRNRRLAMSDLVAVWKLDGWYGGLYDFTLKTGVGGVDADANLNWIKNSFNCTTSGAGTDVTYGASGVIIASGQDTVDTGFNPTVSTSEGFTLNDAHMGVRMETNQANNGYLCGNANFRICPHLATDQYGYRANDGTSKSVGATTEARGHTLASRTAAAVCPLYKDGVNVNAGVTTSTSLTNANFFFGGVATGPSAVGSTISIGHWGQGLTPEAVVRRYNAIAAYRLAIGLT